MGAVNVRAEWIKCSLSSAYFIHEFCYIYDAVLGNWVPFKLWVKQRETLGRLQDDRLVIILKARQLGQTWLVLAYALWLMLFHPVVTVLLFSRRDDEAQYLLERLRGIYSRLPASMQARRIIVSNNHEWMLSNGSVAYAFPTTAGDSYTASLAIVDEADLVENLDFLMNAVKPTIDNGGRMILLSRTNKDTPQSTFKKIYEAAKAGLNGWTAIFLPWDAHPGRTMEWYKEQEREILARTGAYDDLWQQYPNTDAEALAPKTLAKRIPAAWVNQCYREMTSVESTPLRSIHQSLVVYFDPQPAVDYVIGVDPAEGNPTSDDSALTILVAATGEEVASLSDKIQPAVFADIVAQLARAYNNAGVLVERNNHGHLVIHALMQAEDITLLAGPDGNAGRVTTLKSKAEMFNAAADAFRESTTTLHTRKTYFQLISIEGTSLSAPKGEFDDCAISYSLAIVAINSPVATSFSYNYVSMASPIGLDRRQVLTRKINESVGATNAYS